VITVVKVQNKKSIRVLRDTLINQYSYNPDDIVLLYSEKHIKESKQYERLKNSSAKSDSFAQNVKIVICTSFINEGVNIYEKKRQIEFVNWSRSGYFDPSDLIQFTGRWRDAKNRTCFCYCPASAANQERINDKHSYLAKYYSLVSTSKAKAAYYNTVNDSGNIELVEGLTNLLDLDNKFVQYSKKLECYIINETEIIKECEKLRLQYFTTDTALEEINTLEGFNVVYQSDHLKNAKCVKNKIKAQSEISKHDDLHTEDKIINLIKTDLLRFVGSVKSQTEKFDLTCLVSSVFPELDFSKELRIDYEKFTAQHIELFTDKLALCETVVKNICKGLQLGFDKNNIIELLTELKPVKMEGLTVVGSSGNSLLLDQIKTNVVRLKSNVKLSYLFEKIKVQLLLALDAQETKDNTSILTTVQKDNAKLLRTIQTKLQKSFDCAGGKLTEATAKKAINKAYQDHYETINKVLKAANLDPINHIKANSSPSILKRVLNCLLVVDRVGAKEKSFVQRKDVTMLDQIKTDYGLTNFDPTKVLNFWYDLAKKNSQKEAKKTAQTPKSQKQASNPYVQGILSVF